MPIYEYYCKNCDKESEVLQKITDQVLNKCPNCQSSDIKKLVSAAGFRLKGSGWYESDFKSSKQKNLVNKTDPVSQEGKETKQSKASKSEKENKAVKKEKKE